MANATPTMYFGSFCHLPGNAFDLWDLSLLSPLDEDPKSQPSAQVRSLLTMFAAHWQS